MTGSHAWGVQTDESDIDIIFHPDCDFLDFHTVIRECNGIYLHGNADEEEISEDAAIIHYSTTDFESCYVLWKGKVYNLLFMRSEKAYEKWIYATNMMNNCCRSASFKNAIKDKKYRVERFENFLNSALVL